MNDTNNILDRKTFEETIHEGIKKFGLDVVLKGIQSVATDTFQTEKMSIRMTPKQKAKLVRGATNTKQSQNDYFVSSLDGKVLLDEIQAFITQSAKMYKLCGYDKDVFEEVFEDIPIITKSMACDTWPYEIKEQLDNAKALLTSCSITNPMVALADIQKFQTDEDLANLLRTSNIILERLEQVHNLSEANGGIAIPALKFRQKYQFLKYTDAFPQYPTIDWFTTIEHPGWLQSEALDNCVFKMETYGESVVVVDKISGCHGFEWQIGVAAKTACGSMTYIIEDMELSTPVDDVLARAEKLYTLAVNGTDKL